MVATPILPKDNGLKFPAVLNSQSVWQGEINTIAFDRAGIQAKLLNLSQPCYVVRQQEQIGVTNQGSLFGTNHSDRVEILTAVTPLFVSQLGDPRFLETYGVKFAYAAGAMANGIASEEMVIALGKAKILSSFGAGGLVPERIEAAIQRIQKALPKGPYAFNLIHSPSEPTIEAKTVELFLRYQIPVVEASAFLDITASIVRYRAAGLSLNHANQIEIKHRVIAKVSRREIAAKFMQPAPEKILKQLVERGEITELQAKLAAQVSVADDITVESDSGGHTDNRPLNSLLPSILALRDELQAKYHYSQPIRVGAAGGISTPQAVLGAFMMGAAYVVTGSVNQACVEAGTSSQVKALLARAAMTDVAMAPAADMFEMGVKLQVLKHGTLFPMRAQKLFEYYQKYNSIDEIPTTEREQLERKIFRASLDSVWQETISYFSQRDPEQIERAIDHPKRKMALIFRWYLGLSSRWANVGEAGREVDYQIWCGPAMGAFNEWTAGSYLSEPSRRLVVEVADHLMTGAAYLCRLQNLKFQGLELSSSYWNYQPMST